MANFVRAAVITSCLLVPTTLSQYNIESPSITQCLAPPCECIGECRLDSNECGEGSNYLWVPACDGGGALQKEPTFTAAAPTITLDEDNMDANSQIDLGSSSDIQTIMTNRLLLGKHRNAWTSGKTNGSNNHRRVI